MLSFQWFRDKDEIDRENVLKEAAVRSDLCWKIHSQGKMIISFLREEG